MCLPVRVCVISFPLEYSRSVRLAATLVACFLFFFSFFFFCSFRFSVLSDG